MSMLKNAENKQGDERRAKMNHSIELQCFTANVPPRLKQCGRFSKKMDSSHFVLIVAMTFGASRSVGDIHLWNMKAGHSQQSDKPEL